MARSWIDPIGSKQDRTALPSTCTVHAPHWAMPHPNFVPVSPRTSRRTHSKGVSSVASTECTWPLIRRLIMGACLSVTDYQDYPTDSRFTRRHIFEPASAHIDEKAHGTGQAAIHHRGVNRF